MKKTVISPNLGNDYSDLLVQVVGPFVLDRSMEIVVPSQFAAIVVPDNSIECRLEPTDSGSNLFKVIKKRIGYRRCLGTPVQVYFILNKGYEPFSWGFGNIPVNNSRLQDAYHVGAHGTCTFEIKNLKKLVQSFNMTKDITTSVVRGRMIEIIKSVGVDVLSNYFTNTDVSIFEINSHNSEIREKIVNALEEERGLKDIGVRITSLTLEPIHVKEEDEERIAERINEAVKETY